MEAVVMQLHAALEDDPLIDEFDYFFASPEDSAEGRLASAQVQVVGHKVGLSHACVKPLFKYAQSVFDETCNNKDFDKYTDQTCPRHIDDLKTLSRLSRIMLLIKGESHMLFNFRKHLMRKEIVTVQNELVFLQVLFSKHAKSPSGWQHRRWCLLFADKANKGESITDDLTVNWSGDISDNYRPNTQISIPIESEVQLCQLSAERHPKNYYAWMHRLWLTQFMTIGEIQREGSLMNLWLQQHVSDHSAATHSLHVIRINNILSNINKQNEEETLVSMKWASRSVGTRSQCSLLLLHCSLEESASTICRRPGSEALFSHRRALSDALLAALADCAPCGGGWVLLAGSGDAKAFAPIGDVVDSEYATPLDSPLDDTLALYHIKCKTYNETLSNLFDSPQYCSIAEMQTLLQLFLDCEALFFKMCTRVEYHWNGGKQRLLANKYLAFLMYRISVYLCSVSKNYLPRDALSYSQEVEVCLRTAAGVALSRSEGSLIFEVNRALSSLSKRLSSEDSASAKLWLAVNAQTSPTLCSSGGSVHLTPLPGYTTERYYLLSEIEQRIGVDNFICQDENLILKDDSSEISELSAVKYADMMNRIPQSSIRMFYVIWNCKVDKDGSGFKLQVLSLLKGVCVQSGDGLLPTAQLAVEVLVSSSFNPVNGTSSTEYAVVGAVMHWIVDTFSHIFGYVVFGVADDPAGTPALEAVLNTLQHVDCAITDDNSSIPPFEYRHHKPSTITSVLITPARQHLLGHDVLREPDAKSGVRQSLLGSLSQDQVKEWCVKVARKKAVILVQVHNESKKGKTEAEKKGGGVGLIPIIGLIISVIVYLLYRYCLNKI